MKTKQTFLILFITVVFWTVLLYFFDAKELVDMIGVRNGYLITGLVALFGGISSLGGPSYVAVILTFASAGLNPLGLALASGVGVSIGDSLYFFLGKKGRASLEGGKLHSYVEKLSKWIEDKSEAAVALFAYAYCAFTPLPNDVLTVTLGALNQRYRVILPALVLGNITLVFLLATFGKTLPF